MNKIKQNKITFTLILIAIAIIFSSLTILSLPVLFNYESKVVKIEKYFYKNFKIYLKSTGNVSYKPFPKPHLLVEKASLNLTSNKKKENLIDTSNLKIFISLRDIYLREFDNFLSTKISDSNLNLKVSDFKFFREHLYQKVNKPIFFENSKIFLRNKENDVILISPINKISYKINNKTRIKNFAINGEVFGLNFKSEWKRDYKMPKTSFQNINIFNPNIEIKNIFNFKNEKKFNGQVEISYAQNKLEYIINYDDYNIDLFSPDPEKTNFNLESKIQLDPFYFDGMLTIKDKKIDTIIDNILFNLLIYDENYLGNINGNLKIKFNELDNKLIKNGEIDVFINEKKINLKKGYFDLNKIGDVHTEIDSVKKNEDTKLIFKNKLIINNYIEFAKVFQISSKKIKNIKIIYFDLEKRVGEEDFVISNVKINNIENGKKKDEIYLIKNIQNLRSYIRKVID